VKLHLYLYTNGSRGDFARLSCFFMEATVGKPATNNEPPHSTRVAARLGPDAHPNSKMRSAGRPESDRPLAWRYLSGTI